MLSATTAHNVNCNTKKWAVAVLCKAKVASRVYDTVEAHEQFAHVAECYYHVKKSKTGKINNMI